MLIFDELKKNDPQLRFVAAALVAGFFILLTGLWWVQVVSAGEYKSHLETQSYRTIRIPSLRGRILDCEGRVLAENSPRYNLDLYFDELSGDFQAQYAKLRPPKVVKSTVPIWEFWKRPAAGVQKTASLTKKEISNLQWYARYDVAYNVIAKMSQTIGRPFTFNPTNFYRAYMSSLYVPYPIAQSLDAEEVARFEENYSGAMGVDLDVQTTRIYPNGSLAEDVLGYVRQDDSSVQDEAASFNYRLPDYSGVVGIEGARDKQLHGRAGEELVMVNNYGYRQTQNIGSEPEPGDNVVLTLDLDIQKAAEESLVSRQKSTEVHAAIVVMNVRTGDVLAMVSSPALDPNYFTKNLPPDQMQREYEMMEDTNLMPQINRATSGNYEPGSIFKPIVGLAALEDGLNPNETYHVEENPKRPGHGYIRIGNKNIGDLVPPGDYDFKKAIAMSSNSYFIYNGLRTGIKKVVEMSEKFHLGEKTGVLPGQESKGIFPSLEKVESRDWREGDSAYICFGQGEMAVTPIQMAVAYSAIANGGTVLWPRLVARLEPQDPNSGEQPTVYPSGLVRDYLGVHPRSLRILCEAMLSETEEGSGKAAQVPGLPICGKTGTAQVENEHGVFVSQNFWFCSFAPYGNPKYAVVVTVQKPYSEYGFGGTECAPIAHDIYTELVKKDPSILQQVTRN